MLRVGGFVHVGLSHCWLKLYFCSTAETREQRSGSGLPPTTLHKDGWSKAHATLAMLRRIASSHGFLYEPVQHGKCIFVLVRQKMKTFLGLTNLR